MDNDYKAIILLWCPIVRVSGYSAKWQLDNDPFITWEHARPATSKQEEPVETAQAFSILITWYHTDLSLLLKEFIFP